MTTQEEFEMRKTRKTTFYQTVLFERMKTAVINKGLRLTRAALSIGETYKDIRMFLSREQKDELEELSKLYARNVIKPNHHTKISTR